MGVYNAPEATVGSLPLGVDAVLGVDLKKIREVSGLPIEGVLGMDFLSRYIVHIDFDRGKLLLLKSVPKDAGETLPLVSEDGKIPEIDVWVSIERKIRFTIDTGSIGLAADG